MQPPTLEVAPLALQPAHRHRRSGRAPSSIQPVGGVEACGLSAHEARRYRGRRPISRPTTAAAAAVNAAAPAYAYACACAQTQAHATARPTPAATAVALATGAGTCTCTRTGTANRLVLLQLHRGAQEHPRPAGRQLLPVCLLVPRVLHEVGFPVSSVANAACTHRVERPHFRLVPAAFAVPEALDPTAHERLPPRQEGRPVSQARELEEDG